MVVAAVAVMAAVTVASAVAVVAALVASVKGNETYLRAVSGSCGGR